MTGYDLSEKDLQLIVKALACAIAVDHFGEGGFTAEIDAMRELLARLRPHELQRSQLIQDAQVQLDVRGLVSES